MAFQIFAQAMYDTLESHIKVFMIKRGAKHSTKAVHAPHHHHHAPHHTLATIPSGGLEEGEDGKESGTTPAVAAEEGNLGQSPFADVPPDLGAKTSQPWGDHVLGYRRISSVPIEQKLSSHAHHLSTTLSTAAGLESVQSMALQAGLSVRYTGAHTLDTNASTLNTAKSSGFVTFASTMSKAMYRLDTGLACEDVPMNDEGVFVPLWLRVLVRSAYVGLITLVSNHQACRLGAGCAAKNLSSSLYKRTCCQWADKIVTCA